MKDGLSYDKKAFKDITDSLMKKVENIERAIEFQFISVIGPETANHAKDFSQFKDQTGNLRSSMGFIVVKDSQIISSGGFENVNGPQGNEGEGVRNGKQYAEELARNAGKGYVLIVVAGMNYAGYVEAKGYDVLTQTGTYLESEVKEMIDRILKKAGFNDKS